MYNIIKQRKTQGEEGENVKVSKKKLECAIARALIDPQELAQKAGLSYPVVRRAKSGASVKLSSVGKIARALGVDPADIIEEED